VEEPALREELANRLAISANAAASVMLAKSAIFDPSQEVRASALKALKNRNRKDYSKTLMHGMRYPLPSVVKRSADVIIALDRKDMLPEVADLLGEHAPNDPAMMAVSDKDVHVVREVVRINHHRNCLLCHAPIEMGRSEEVGALIPTPGQPIPRSSTQYYGDQFLPDSLAVRADTTYLRQDFSVLMPVKDAHPWPEHQRFDFLIRTRVVAGDELAQLQKKVADRPLGYLSANHKEAVRVLTTLSGQVAAANPAAWRRVLGANRQED